MGARGKIIRVEVNFLEFIYKFQNIRDSIQGDTSVITLFPWLSIHKNQKLCFSISSIYWHATFIFIAGLLRPQGRARQPAALHLRHGVRQLADEATQEHDIRRGGQVQAQDAEGDGSVIMDDDWWREIHAISVIWDTFYAISLKIYKYKRTLSPLRPIVSTSGGPLQKMLYVSSVCWWVVWIMEEHSKAISSHMRPLFDSLQIKGLCLLKSTEIG